MIMRRKELPDYVDTIDGFRAVATFLVLIFHYWQQSWVTMEVSIGPLRINFLPVVSIGSLGVELLFVISGFCLYYPVARHPKRPFSVGNYFYRRAIRILPTYLLCVLICGAWQYGRLSPALWREQFLGNLTLTQTMTESLYNNRINAVLWSIAIEVQFYLIFPLLIIPFRKHPFLVMAAAAAIGEGWRMYLQDVDASHINFLMNQLPGMIDVFVSGMLSAHIAASLKRHLGKRAKRKLTPAFTAAAIAFAMLYFLVTMYIHALRYSTDAAGLSRLQMHTRKFVIAAFAGATCCSTMAMPWLHRLLGNPVTRFLSGISYQVYLWHAWIALTLKDLRVPAYVTERPMDDPAWRWPYMMLCCALTLAVSVLITFCIEQPIHRALKEHAPAWARRREDPS
ncbi:MAG: acyltransferase [Clostridia bacterium]|nr:acyltransferase [Clostridia bacterium]